MKKLLGTLTLASISLSLVVSSASFAAARANVIITTDGPQAQEINIGSNDVPLLNLHIDTNVRVEFKNFPIRIRMPEDPANTAQGLLNGNQPNLTDIKVINSATGEVMMGPIDSTQLRSTIDNPNTTITDRGGDQIAFFLFEEDFVARIYHPLDLTITADIADNANLNGSNVTMTMRNSAAYPEIRKMSNNAWATLNPRGNIDSAVHQIVAPQPENLNHPIIALAADSPQGVRVPTVEDKLLSINITAQAENILLDAMTINLVSEAAFNFAPLEPVECTLVDRNSRYVFANGYVTFNSPSIAKVTFDIDEDSIQLNEEFEISARTSKTIDINCDTQGLLINNPNIDQAMTASLNLGNENTPGSFHWSFDNQPEQIFEWVQNNYQGSTLMGNPLFY